MFKTNSESFKILVSLRDEAHRFAITYHRKLREGSSFESELDIIGLSESKKVSLLKHFETVEQLKMAEVDEIMKVKGVGVGLSKKIYEYFRKARD